MLLSFFFNKYFYFRFYPFFKLFHNPYHHHPHHKVYRYVTYYDDPYYHHSYGHSSQSHHNYNSYSSIDRTDDTDVETDDVLMMNIDCDKLNSPEKELCVLCWQEEDLDRRRSCYQDPCSIAPPDKKEICYTLAAHYLNSFSVNR